MKTIFPLLMVAVIFLAGAVFATQASAQYQQGSSQGQYPGMPGQFQGRQGQFQGTSTPVNGTTYANTNFGVQVSIPSGWSGFEMKRTSGATTVTLAPGGFQSMSGGQRPPVSISLSMTPISSTQNPQNFGSRNPQDAQRNPQFTQTCTNSTSAKTVNGLNFNEVIIQCTGTITTKSQSDKTQTSTAYVTLGLRAGSTADFDSQVATFESMLGTLQVTTPSTGTSSSNPVPSSTTAVATVIPTWVKKNAGYWATGTVGDSDFVSGVQYLIQQKIMKIPPSTTTSTTNSTSSTIPTWIKTNAGWWSTGQITDDDFVKGIQYLISNKIMKIS